MSLQEITLLVIEFVQQHQAWAVPLVFLLAFGESLAFLSLLVPATVLLLAIGGLMGQAHIAFWPVWLAATAGAYFGDWVSYFIGIYYKDRVGHIWPLKNNPELLVKGHAFFERWGMLGVFIGRFFGPLRAVVPLVAGICTMPKMPFQITNLISAMVWAAAMLAPGVFGLPLLLDY